MPQIFRQDVGFDGEPLTDTGANFASVSPVCVSWQTEPNNGNLEDTTMNEHATSPAYRPLLVRVEEAARILALDPLLFYELMASGALPSVKIGGSRRVPVAELERWVQERLQRG